MDQKSPLETEDNNELDALESETTLVSSSPGGEGGESQPSPDKKPEDNKPPKPKGRFKQMAWALANRINIYLLLFILLLVLAGAVSIIGYIKSRDSGKKAQDITSEPLSQEVLDQLRATDVSVGDPKQVLTVESNAVFGGTVLVRGGLEVAGAIKVGGPLTLPGITVAGISNFDQVQMNSLQVANNTTVQGQLAVQRGLTVSGSASISGSLSAGALIIDTLQVNRDLQLNRHIDAGGGTPGRSNGGALGSGGTSSVSGTDTAGTVNINTGGGPGGGCFITVTFTQRFSSTPHVVITPVGAGAAGLNYYVERSSGDFRVCATNPSASQGYVFDYIVID